MSRYKEHRGPKRRGYDEDYTPDYQAAERQPEYFSPRPSLTQGSEPVEATVKWFNADKGFGFVVVAGGPDAFLPARALEMAGHSSVPDIRGVAELSHRPARGPYTQFQMRLPTSDMSGHRRLALCGSSSSSQRGCPYLVLRVAFLQSLSCRPPLCATSIGERPCVVPSYFYLHWPSYRFFAHRRQLKCPICRKTCARGLPR